MDRITGIVLAGGLGRRMGSVDKGLQLLHGRTMLEHVLERFAPQVDEVLLNANRNLEAYAALLRACGGEGRVVPDAVGGYAGPLAGLHAGLSVADTPLVATVPCDSPFLPLDLVARLREALESGGAELAVAKTGAQAHPVFVLARRALLPGLAAFLQGGGRKIDAWYARLAIAEVAFDDDAEAFRNINTPEELSAA